jgi:hypothetical protein
MGLGSGIGIGTNRGLTRRFLNRRHDVSDFTEDEVVEYYIEQAESAEKMGELNRAISLYRPALPHDNSNEVALEAIRRLSAWTPGRDSDGV